MLSSSRLTTWLMGLWLVTSAAAYAENAELGCPLSHNDKSLRDVGSFDGDPLEQGELMPEPGRFVVPADQPVSWSKIPGYTLGCLYDQPRKDMVTVILPRNIKVYDFHNDPQVRCH